MYICMCVYMYIYIYIYIGNLVYEYYIYDFLKSGTPGQAHGIYIHIKLQTNRHKAMPKPGDDTDPCSS